MKKLIIAIFVILSSFSVRAEGYTAEDFLSQFEEDQNFQEAPLEIKDPFEGFNRTIFGMYKFTYDFLGLKYAIYGYSSLPDNPKGLLRNFYNNYSTPGTVVHHLLQGKFKSAMRGTVRFFVNTSFGLIGFIDVASMLGDNLTHNDLGATLYHYGVGEGVYIFFLGPSNVRDTLSTGFSSFAYGVGPMGDPKLLIKNTYTEQVRLSYTNVFVVLDVGSDYQNNNAILSTYFDEYVAIRSLYTDYRRSFLRTLNTLD